jgi:hypothetical protein
LRSASLAFGPSDDPCADKQSHWRPKKAVLLFLLLALLYLLNGRGRLHEWTCGIVGTKPAATGTVQGDGAPHPKTLPPK